MAIAYGISEFLKRSVRARTVGYLFLDRNRPVDESQPSQIEPRDALPFALYYAEVVDAHCYGF